MNYWLMKSEPAECSIDDLSRAPAQTLPWTGVRNYQARNFMRDQMQIGDGVLFYHSSCPAPEMIGIAGIARVASKPYTDASQFDPQGAYYDAKSKPEAPRWVLVDIAFERKTKLINRTALRADPVLQTMQVLQPGSRLSITPVTPAEWARLQELLQDAT
ncbi:EVE domain-containing protein [Paucibacter sp. TC2R-5]|uniref:EVE domain-containing protein n=1 Tax=Paucibacter sp. TC2R-5 TaxID=2893555 RepID=UPI0021E4933F|nr:EVE domain-containing protein [Paucibacter sp. TC2R-5]MCV2361031.1 EVE domain-containing protein [Paucibacter sp. TC2R-5]